MSTERGILKDFFEGLHALEKGYAKKIGAEILSTDQANSVFINYLRSKLGLRMLPQTLKGREAK